MSGNFESRDLKAEVWGVASDYENLMMNNNAKIVLWCLIYNFWPANLVIRIVSWTLQTKSGLDIMSGQLEEIENWLQMGSIWGQNEMLEGLGRRLWDQQPGLMSSNWSQGRLPQFRPSILGSFWTSFWKIFETHAALKDNHVWAILVELDSKWPHLKWRSRGGYEGTKGGSNNVTRLLNP